MSLLADTSARSSQASRAAGDTGGIKAEGRGWGALTSRMTTSGLLGRGRVSLVYLEGIMKDTLRSQGGQVGVRWGSRGGGVGVIWWQTCTAGAVRLHSIHNIVAGDRARRTCCMGRGAGETDV